MITRDTGTRTDALIGAGSCRVLVAVATPVGGVGPIDALVLELQRIQRVVGAQHGARHAILALRHWMEKGRQ